MLVNLAGGFVVEIKNNYLITVFYFCLSLSFPAYSEVVEEDRYDDYVFSVSLNDIVAKDWGGVTYTQQVELTKKYRKRLRLAIQSHYAISGGKRIANEKIWNHLYDGWYHFSVDVKHSKKVSVFNSSSAKKILAEECIDFERRYQQKQHCSVFDSGRYPVKITGLVDFVSGRVIRFPSYMKAGKDGFLATDVFFEFSKQYSKAMKSLEEGVLIDPGMHMNGLAIYGGVPMGYHSGTGVYDEFSPLYRKNFYGCLVPRMHGVTDVDGNGKKELIVFSVNGKDTIQGFRSREDVTHTSIGFYLAILGLDEGGKKLKYWLNEEVVGLQENYLNAVKEGGSRVLGYGEGEYREARFFFSDHDKNGKLDVIVWKKFYDIKNIKWIPSAKLVREEYYALEETSSGFHESGLLDKYKGKEKETFTLVWGNGFPKNLACKNPFNRIFD